jgi:hypothetical protein
MRQQAGEARLVLRVEGDERSLDAQLQHHRSQLGSVSTPAVGRQSACHPQDAHRASRDLAR